MDGPCHPSIVDLAGGFGLSGSADWGIRQPLQDTVRRHRTAGRTAAPALTRRQEIESVLRYRVQSGSQPSMNRPSCVPSTAMKYSPACDPGLNGG